MTSSDTHTASGASTLVSLTCNGMGQGDEVLRMKLLTTWLTLTLENGTLPGAMSFVTDAVRLVLDDSPVLDLLRTVEERGTRLIVCTTCLNHLGVRDRVAVGIVGGMTDILAAQWKASKVIPL